MCARSMARVVIMGWVERVMGECSLQCACQGYIRDVYNDECEENVVATEKLIRIQYGEYVTVNVMGFEEGEEVAFNKESSANLCTTVYFDVEKEGDWEYLQEGESERVW